MPATWLIMKSLGFCKLGPLSEKLFCITSTSNLLGLGLSLTNLFSSHHWCFCLLSNSFRSSNSRLMTAKRWCNLTVWNIGVRAEAASAIFIACLGYRLQGHAETRRNTVNCRFSAILRESLLAHKRIIWCSWIKCTSASDQVGGAFSSPETLQML